MHRMRCHGEVMGRSKVADVKAFMEGGMNMDYMINGTLIVAVKRDQTQTCRIKAYAEKLNVPQK